jgi:hypothetical protein
VAIEIIAFSCALEGTTMVAQAISPNKNRFMEPPS